VCIACDFVTDTCRCSMSLHQNPSCLGTFTVIWVSDTVTKPATTNSCRFCLFSVKFFWCAFASH
jgi:hypothetical protein